MRWFDKWLYKKVRDMWDNRYKYDDEGLNKVAIGQTAMIERGRTEGDNRITFELSSAVGGKILNVRHYDERKDRHDTQTYVIPNGEDVGERVAKIVNLELFKQ